MRLRFHPAAIAELDEAVDYLASQRGGYGARMFEEVSTRVAQAARWPKSGAPISGFAPRYDVRQFATKRFPYLVVTAIIDGERSVVAIAHTSREPTYWRARLQAPTER